MIPDDLCAEVIGQEGFISAVDGDVTTPKVVAKHGDEPDEVLADKKFEDQRRSIKRKRLMTDKKTKDDAE